MGGLKRLGYDVDLPKATFYVWMATPPGMTSMSFAAHLLEQAGSWLFPALAWVGPERGTCAWPSRYPRCGWQTLACPQEMLDIGGTASCALTNVG